MAENKSGLHAEALKAIHGGQEYLLRLRRSDGSWQIPAYLGPVYICQFYLMSRWAGLAIDLDEPRFRELLLSRQLDDGSWYQIKDINNVRGELNTTILTYWTLKGMGESPDSAPMKKAREYILKNGGLAKVEIFLVAILALFGIVPWDRVPATPYISFFEFMPMNYRSFAHWAKPHMLPLAYLCRMRAHKDMGDKFGLEELKLERDTKPIPARKKVNSLIDGWIIRKLLSKQGFFGSWNGYTTSTIFSLVALADFKEHCSLLNREIELATARGLKHLHTLYLNEENCAYVGISCDGTYWETILTSTALLSSGFKPEQLQHSLEYVRDKQMENGGMPYGMDFQADPDVDDTSASVVLWSLTEKKYHENAKRALDWLMKRQNSDGGWGAFNQNNRNNPLLNFFLKGYGEVESLFDYSSADCTGHVLEAMALHGFNKDNHAVAKKAVQYLKNTQKKSGAWTGRWALNTIFGTSVSLTGLIATGESLQTDYIQRALKFLFSKQNTDGGFGETTLSYSDESLSAVGQSTPTQTAWALMTFVKAGAANSESAERAAEYLIQYFKKHGKWFDPSVTATGHPGQAYMHYSVYAPAFPLIALSHFLQARGVEVKPTSFNYEREPFFEGRPPVVTKEMQL
ncbi:MAG: prenyltransferase/squalene oxidase repeat-containing protein [Bacteriovoracia bacterium]